MRLIKILGLILIIALIGLWFYDPYQDLKLKPKDINFQKYEEIANAQVTEETNIEDLYK